jgi:hypothetical protein
MTRRLPRPRHIPAKARFARQSLDPRGVHRPSVDHQPRGRSRAAPSQGAKAVKRTKPLVWSNSVSVDECVAAIVALRSPRSCSVGGCPNPYLAQGWCEMHYTRMRRYGSLDRPEFDYADRFWAKVLRSDGCWLWSACVDEHGYGSFVRLQEDGSHRLEGAHRVAWELTHGPIPDGLRVCHHCDTPPCVRPDHLFLGTQADNMADMQRKGRARNQYTLRTAP